MLKRVVDLEKQVNRLRDKGPTCFFKSNMIPAKFCKENGTGCPSIMDVVNYVNRNDAQIDMFEPEEGYSCMSIYHGLCE